MSHDATVGKIWGRRELLRASMQAGAGLVAAKVLAPMVLAESPAAAKVDLVASPRMTEGPFFVDENLNRSDLIGDTKRASVADGARLALAFSVFKLVDGVLVPMKGVHVDVWHCDAAGAYSDENNPMNHEDTSKQTWLRGYQATDAAGAASFRTIFPGWYNGRTAHIHFKVRQYADSGKPSGEFTSQLFFQDDDAAKVFEHAPYNAPSNRRTTNERDGIFREKLADGTTAGSHLTLKLSPAETKGAFASQYAIVLTDQSLKGGGERHGPHGRNGRPPGPPPGGRPPGDFPPGDRPPGPPPEDGGGPPR